ncbi:hypothetical protein C3747_234g63 [Trypanosoma cruzi]|uniref:Uncharacterized protein n=1 Tax=Trypanosoma cruzi TaxID=5693 RepID=A0A2V2VSF8_TRYCR|nr:hypothetical protein C3747_234g63 [Trypanosoma cruzi]
MEWVQRRNQRVQSARLALEEKALAECRFQPKLDGSFDVSSIGGSSVHSRIVDQDALVANAEARIYTELGLLRSQAALRDAAFIGGVREPLSAVTLASAPRPSRSSVERYARSLSALGPRSILGAISPGVAERAAAPPPPALMTAAIFTKFMTMKTTFLVTRMKCRGSPTHGLTWTRRQTAY